MSYVRFGEADVYVYADVAGYLCCCGCSIDAASGQFYSTEEMIEHLQKHIAAGDHVPDFVIPDLEADAESNDQWIEQQQQSTELVDRQPSARFKRGLKEALAESEELTPEPQALKTLTGEVEHDEA